VHPQSEIRFALLAISAPCRRRVPVLQRPPAAHLPDRHFRILSSGDLDGPRDVSRHHVSLPAAGHGLRRSTVRAHNSLFCFRSSGALSVSPRRHGLYRRFRKPYESHDHWLQCRPQGALMSELNSRRGLLKAGLAATAGASGLAVAARLADRYGLIPPDHGGIYGVGETLTYAGQRLLMSQHSLAREFGRSEISKVPHP